MRSQTQPEDEEDHASNQKEEEEDCADEPRKPAGQALLDTAGIATGSRRLGLECRHGWVMERDRGVFRGPWPDEIFT